MKNGHPLLLSITLLLLTVTTAQAQTGGAGTQPVRIQFEGKLAGKAFACGAQYAGIGSKASTVTPVDLRFFASGFELLRSDGSSAPVDLDQDGIWQYKSLALIDLEDATGSCRNGNPETHREVTGTVPPGTYVGLRFTLGVPLELDHIDSSAAPSPLNMTAMLWNWQNGYKFLRAEVSVVGAQPSNMGAVTRMPKGTAGFPVHVGSTGCASSNPNSAPGSECRHPNRAAITLPEFDVAKDVVVFDLGKLLAHSDLSANSPNTAPGCMSFERDPDCEPIMEALGLPYGGAAAKPQVVFYRRTE